MKRYFVLIACFGLAGCAHRSPLTLTYNCAPAGALLVQQQNESVIGICPSSYRYEFPPHFFKNVEANVIGVTARWASGATASTPKLVTLYSANGMQQQITLMRPSDAPGLESDQKVAAEYAANPALRTEAWGTPYRAFTEAHFADYLEIVTALPVNQLAMKYPGAEIVPPKIDPVRPLTTPDAMYPDASKDAREEGKVDMLLTLDRDGEVKKVALQSTSGFERLDAAAVGAASSWRFLPGAVDGKPTAMKMSFRVVFKADATQSR